MSDENHTFCSDCEHRAYQSEDGRSVLQYGAEPNDWVCRAFVLPQAIDPVMGVERHLSETGDFTDRHFKKCRWINSSTAAKCVDFSRRDRSA